MEIQKHTESLSLSVDGLLRYEGSPMERFVAKEMATEALELARILMLLAWPK